MSLRNRPRHFDTRFLPQVLRFVAHPNWCYTDSGSTTRAGEGDAVYNWWDVTETYRLTQATAGRRVTLNFVTGQWQTTGSSTTYLYMQLSASLDLTWKTLAIRYSCDSSLGFAGPFGTSFVSSAAVYCWNYSPSGGILNGSFIEAATLAGNGWSDGTKIASLSGTPPTRSTGGAKRNLVIARTSAATRNIAYVTHADYDAPTARNQNGGIVELLLSPAEFGMREVAQLQRFWGA